MSCGAPIKKLRQSLLSFIGVVNQPPSFSAGISGRSNNDYSTLGIILS